MGNSQTQNVQRGIVFINFLAFVFFLVITMINFCKNRIDACQDEQGDEYKVESKSENKEEKEESKEEGKEEKKERPRKVKKQVNKQGVEQQSQMQFDEDIKNFKHMIIQDDDPPAIKLAKKNQELEVGYFPFFTIYVLNIVTGTSKAFLFVNFFFTIPIVLIFNVLKAHRSCMNSVCANVFFQNIWLFMILFAFINVWGAFTISMPYIVL